MTDNVKKIFFRNRIVKNVFQDHKRWTIQSRISSCFLHEMGFMLKFTIKTTVLIIWTVMGWLGSSLWKIWPLKDAYCIYFILFYCSFHGISTPSPRKTNSTIGRSLGTVLWISIYSRRHFSSRKDGSTFETSLS